MSPQRARKLKDTCDLCSVSKIKCERQWPQCSRCEKLGHQCIYSPARRQGRPHPARKKAEKNSPELIRPPSQRSTNGANTTLSPTAPLVARNPIPGEKVKRVRGNNCGQSHRTEPCRTSHQPDVLLEYQSNKPGQQNPPILPFQDNIEWCNLPIYTTSLDTLLSPTESSNSRSTADSDITVDTHSTNSSRSDRSSNSISFECSDCTMLATDILQGLTTISTRSFPDSDLKGTTFDAELNTTSNAVKRLSAILICPCSENPDVGLLCIAVSTAILDVYQNLLERCTEPAPPTPPTTNSTSNGPCNTVEWLNSVSLIQSMISNSNDSRLQDEVASRKLVQQSIVRRVLEDLPKAANVVLQLERRYSSANPTAAEGKDANEGMASLLPAMAIEQRVRLKDIVQKATGLLGAC